MPSYSLQYADTAVVALQHDASKSPAPPPLSLMALGFKFGLVPSPQGKLVRQVQAVAGMLHPAMPLADVVPRAEDARPDFAFAARTLECATETALLDKLCDVIKHRNPDLLLGHGIDSGDLDFVVSRMRALGVDATRLGRFASHAPLKTGFTRMSVTHTPGRVLVDTLKVAREHLPPQRDYAIDALAPMETPASSSLPSQQQLRGTGEAAADEAMRKASQAMRLAIQLEAVSLSARLTMIGGNLWRRTLAGGRAERIEYLLLHAFQRAGYVVPDKQTRHHATAPRAEEAEDGSGGDEAEGEVGYQGGMVLEPRKGLYENMILVMDFASLYPSIIMEKDICFTTLDRHYSHDAALKSRAADQPRAVLPSVIESLVVARKRARKDMAAASDAAKRAQLDVEQKALKITANSMYGCLGFSSSRFFAKNLAAAVTGEGRLLLQQARNAGEALGYDVIYGDTDSIMLDTQLRPANAQHVTVDEMAQVQRIAERIEAAVNASYTDIRLATDSVFCPLLLLMKKKYGAVALEQKKGAVVAKVHVRGLDQVRRDWCLASRQLGRAVLDVLLSRRDRDAVASGVLQLVEAFGTEAAQLPIESWVVGKALSKSVEAYKAATPSAHVAVARAMVAKGVPVGAGDHVRYVICDDSRTKRFGETGQGPLSDKAFSPEEMAQHGLQPDLRWYKEKQILPPIERLVEPIKDRVTLNLLRVALQLDVVNKKPAATEQK